MEEERSYGLWEACQYANVHNPYLLSPLFLNMKKVEEIYATWPQVIFAEIVMLVAIIFMALEYLASGSLEVVKALVLVSLLGFFSSVFMMLSAMGIFPIMRMVERRTK